MWTIIGVPMCPCCHEPMLILETDGVEIDRCDRCGGTWLDAGELALILESRGSGTDRLEEALGSAVVERPTDRRCPRCRRKMQEVRMSAQPVIEIDRCRRGHGFWCDRGEMAALLSRFGRDSAITSFLADVISPPQQNGGNPA